MGLGRVLVPLPSSPVSLGHQPTRASARPLFSPSLPATEINLSSATRPSLAAYGLAALLVHSLHHALPCARRSPDPIEILCRSPTTPPKNSAHLHPGAWDTHDCSYLPPSPAIVPLSLLPTLACQLRPAKPIRRDACPSRHGQDAHPHPRAIGLSGAAGLDDRPGRHSSCDMGTYCCRTTILSVADIASSPTTTLCWTYGMAISALTHHLPMPMLTSVPDPPASH